VVCDAVSTANSELETSFAVSHIKDIENDAKPEIIYGVLAIAILRHLHSGGEFIEIHRKEIET
jgi:hypothetical protein